MISENYNKKIKVVKFQKMINHKWKQNAQYQVKRNELGDNEKNYRFY